MSVKQDNEVEMEKDDIEDIKELLTEIKDLLTENADGISILCVHGKRVADFFREEEVRIKNQEERQEQELRLREQKKEEFDESFIGSTY